jgi:hypothetical protein
MTPSPEPPTEGLEPGILARVSVTLPHMDLSDAVMMKSSDSEALEDIEDVGESEEVRLPHSLCHIRLSLLTPVSFHPLLIPLSPLVFQSSFRS